MKKHYIKIFDTTLRDGQQCPGAGMSLENNLQYARLAKSVGVDILEAGFPSASRLDFKIVHEIAKLYSDDHHSPIVSALCQLREAQVDITIKALEPLVKQKKARLHVYLPVDPNLMKASLGDYANNKNKMIKDISYLVKKATDGGLEVEFSPEGYSRMGKNFDFVTEVIYAAISSKASIINCPDTIGGACRWEGDDYFVEKMKIHAEMVKQAFPDRQITWSAHCHNDFGLALENTMHSVFQGPVRQIEGCFNGVGERAGNVALEQCIMYIKNFGENKVIENSFYTGIHTEKMQTISDFVSDHMLSRQYHWPINGKNAARHLSGGHTNAIIKNPQAYQPFDPAEVGNSISFIFGPLSGSNHAKKIIESHGFVCDNHEKKTISQYIKDYYQDRRKGITEEELMTAYFDYRNPIKIKSFDYNKSHSNSLLILDGQLFDQNGLIEIDHAGKDSAIAALNAAISKNMPGIYIKNYMSESVDEGIHAISHSHITVEFMGKRYPGEGKDQDIEISAFKALIDGSNKAYINENYSKKEK